MPNCWRVSLGERGCRVVLFVLCPPIHETVSDLESVPLSVFVPAYIVLATAARALSVARFRCSPRSIPVLAL